MREGSPLWSGQGRGGSCGERSPQRITITITHNKKTAKQLIPLVKAQQNAAVIDWDNYTKEQKLAAFTTFWSSLGIEKPVGDTLPITTQHDVQPPVGPEYEIVRLPLTSINI